MAAQLSWSLFVTPGSTRPLGPAKVWEDHADVRERAKRVLDVADVWVEPVVRERRVEAARGVAGGACTADGCRCRRGLETEERG